MGGGPLGRQIAHLIDDIESTGEKELIKLMRHENRDTRVLTAFLSVALMDVPPICGRLGGSKASIRKRGDDVFS